MLIMEVKVTEKKGKFHCRIWELIITIISLILEDKDDGIYDLCVDINY